MHFSLSLLSEYLNIDEGISKKSPFVGQAFRRPGTREGRLILDPKPHQPAATPWPSLKFWNLEFVKYSF